MKDNFKIMLTPEIEKGCKELAGIPCPSCVKWLKLEQPTDQVNYCLVLLKDLTLTRKGGWLFKGVCKKGHDVEYRPSPEEVKFIESTFKTWASKGGNSPLIESMFKEFNADSQFTGVINGRKDVE
jgi:hypothetical protein